MKKEKKKKIYKNRSDTINKKEKRIQPSLILANLLPAEFFVRSQNG
jgi:hypothetical protein